MEAVEQFLRDDLARGDAVLGSTRPVLRHLLACADQSLFTDEVLATMRGMIADIARQLLYALGKAENIEDLGGFSFENEAALAQLLFEDVSFLTHVHALTVEVQIADRLRQRSGIDCVLSPLLQELAASKKAEQAQLSMYVLSAQARFVQQVRRMEHPLGELPADLHHRALLALQNEMEGRIGLPKALEQLRAEYDESGSRLGLITRMLLAMGKHADRALAIDHAGLSILCSALSIAAEQDRNLTILSFSENQTSRLALSLRAGGLKPPAGEEQFLYIHPEIALPEGFETLSRKMARQILQQTNAGATG